MFGYVRPLKGELKVREYEEFKAVYCGLCHALKRKCGFRARFIVNYDFTFLAMLLSTREAPEYGCGRCAASPFKKKRFAVNDPALDLAADCSVILTYWKLRDNVRDSGPLKSLAARFSSLLLRRAYRRAALRNPGFDALARQNLAELHVLEEEGCASIDRASEKFSLILAGVAPGEEAQARRRVLREALYHVGRAVYIMDAADDFPDDRKKGAYNVLAHRFGAEGGELGESDRDEIKLTLAHSQNLLISAFELLEPNAWRGILENIVYFGIPFVSGQILSGQWRRTTGKPDKNRPEL